VSDGDWQRATALRHLADACAWVYDTHQAPETTEAAALRVVALTLAGDATTPGTDAPGVLRTVAATVTVVENRSKGESPTGESIILALL
jgi:hypothetical protein